MKSSAYKCSEALVKQEAMLDFMQGVMLRCWLMLQLLEGCRALLSTAEG